MGKLVEKDMQKVLKNAYQGNKSSFKDKKVASTFNAKAINKVNVVESFKLRCSYRDLTLLRMKLIEALKRVKSQGLLKLVGLTPLGKKK